jgi:hypothetical protein
MRGKLEEAGHLEGEAYRQWALRAQEVGMRQVLYELRQEGYSDNVLMTFIGDLGLRPSDIIDHGEWPIEPAKK